TAPRDIEQIAVSAAQGPAQRADLKFEITFIDIRVGPDARYQLVPADDFARMLDQGDQHIKGATTETNRSVTLQQQPPRREKAERSKPDRALSGGSGEVSHF